MDATATFPFRFPKPSGMLGWPLVIRATDLCHMIHGDCGLPEAAAAALPSVGRTSGQTSILHCTGIGASRVV